MKTIKPNIYDKRIAKDNFNHIIGKKLKNLRKNHQLTLKQLAQILSISAQQIHKYETGQNSITIESLYIICQKLNIDINYFFKNIDYNENKEDKEFISLNRINPLQITLVEDSSSDCFIFQESLSYSEIKHNLTVFSNVKDTEIFLKTKKNKCKLPNIIFLDINLPVVNGFELLKSIKRNPEISYIQIIILTHSINQAELQKAYDLGASGYIVKEIELDNYRKRIKECLKYWNNIILPVM